MRHEDLCLSLGLRTSSEVRTFVGAPARSTVDVESGIDGQSNSRR